ncbi:PREDICTED: zinc finger protein ZXDC-like [Propithecus coquereli]|uniref:zinc finger protein ZXDC-like n=1 Tax=Propithecus coquereli TaxID=379532 RepID=UPI00063F6AFE|nr:PREDICTED: zinc finger protein ZXDC-like [Propithecus coquereli]
MPPTSSEKPPQITLVHWVCWFSSVVLGAPGPTQRELKDGSISPSDFQACLDSWLCESLLVPGGAHSLQIHLLQDEPSGDGVLLDPSPQPPALHPFLTVDLPVCAPQETPPAAAGGVPAATVNPWDLQQWQPPAGPTGGHLPGPASPETRMTVGFGPGEAPAGFCSGDQPSAVEMFGHLY